MDGVYYPHLCKMTWPNVSLMKKGVSSDNITDIMIHANGTAIYFFPVSAQTSLKCTHDEENGMMNSRDVT